MDFSLTEEQAIFQDSFDKFIQENYSLDQRRRFIAQPDGFDRDNWCEYANLGWLMLPFAEQDGGIGGGPVELMLLMQAFGRGLVVEPFLATAVLSGGLLKRAANETQKAEHLAPLMQGQILMAFAYAEPQARFNLADVATRAVADGDGYRLSGHKTVVLHGNAADRFIVSARTGGEQRDEFGVSLFVVNAAADGVQRREYQTVDGLRAADLYLDDVGVGSNALIGERDKALGVIHAAVDEATIAVCAEALGAMEVLHRTTIEYLKTRVQFDQPLSSFQVLQHRLVDMFVEYEQVKSLLYLAVAKMEEGAADTAKWISALKVKVCETGRFIGQQAIQLHGGMGMTDELHVGHYFKRLMVIESLFGNADHHLQRFMTLGEQN